MINRFSAAIAYVKRLIKAVATLFYEVRTCLITSRAGGAFDTTDKNLSTSICLVAMITMDAKVVSIVEGTLVIPIAQPMFFDLIRNRSWILAKVSGDVFVRLPLIEGSLNELTVSKG